MLDKAFKMDVRLACFERGTPSCGIERGSIYPIDLSSALHKCYRMYTGKTTQCIDLAKLLGYLFLLPVVLVEIKGVE